MKTGFVKAALWYAVIFLSILALALILQWNWLAVYDNCRIDNVIASYMAALTPTHVRNNCYDSLDFLDTNIQTKDTVFENCIMPYLNGELSYRKNSAACTDTRQYYVILSGEQKIGQVWFEQDEEKSFLYMFGTELRAWHMEGDEFDFSFLNEDASKKITVPEEYKVSCNGYVLGEKYITDRNNSYPQLDYLTEYGLVLPYMVTYTVNGFVGDVQFLVTDNEGNSAEAESIEGYEEKLLNNCSDSEIDAMTAFIDKYCKAYVAFMGSTRDSIYGNYDNLKPYLLEGSEYASRMNSALEGMVWSNNKYNEVLNIKINYIVNIGDNKYVCDIIYDVKTMGASNEYSTTRNYVRVFTVRNNSEIHTYEMVPYKNAEVVNE